LHLSTRFFQVLFSVAILFVIGFLVPVISALAQIALAAFVALTIFEFIMLFRIRDGITVDRLVPNRLSNGDENVITLSIFNNYAFNCRLEIIDELPPQFQIRDFSIRLGIDSGKAIKKNYTLRPTERGVYNFGFTICYASTTIGLVLRKYELNEETEVKVYPSFIQMRKFELYAISNRLTDIGIKKIRRIGHTMEFDQIRDYVRGDDVRSINWKATARANSLMINQYQDEKSQQVVNVIDMGRVMKMPFDGLHLLDYAINTSLVISNIALLKEDKAGLVTFSNNKSVVVKPEKKRTHIQRIQETLYNLETDFLESDYEKLLISLRAHVRQRSLVLLYTNFENYSSMERQLPFLQRIAKDHLLVTVFFENTELSTLLEMSPSKVGEIYTKTIAEQFNYEKKQIVKALNQRGIHTILTPPKELSVNAINKYLELKARGLI
jgi:uncharacterized protein (DUF58 family)